MKLKLTNQTPSRVDLTPGHFIIGAHARINGYCKKGLISSAFPNFRAPPAPSNELNLAK